MPRGAELVIKIITDAQQAAKGIDDANGKFGKFNDTMGKLVGPAAAVVGGIAVIGTKALQSASEVEQAMGGIDAVFGESAGQIKAWGKQAAESAGLSEAAYGQMATVMGAQLKNMGVPMEDVADKTGSMIQLGADLAAQFGGSSADAVAALSSALRGEADPAEKYGLALNQTAVNARLAAKGLDGLTGDQLAAAKAATIMEMATEQAGGAVGAYARESDTLAGSQQTLNASWENAAAALGESLLPIITPVVQALAEFAKWIQENTTLVTVIIGIIGALAVAVLAYAAAQAVMNAVMWANPIAIIIGLIVLLIAALVAAVIWVANNTEAIGKFFADMWAGIQDVVAAVAGWFQAVWGAVCAWFMGIWASVAGFFQGIWAGILAVVNSVIAGIRAVVNSVVQFFVSAWTNAVNMVNSVIRTLQAIFTSVFNAIMVPINAVVGAFNAVIGAIKNVISWLGKIKIPDIFGAIGGMMGGRSVSVSATAAPAALSAFSGPSIGALTSRAVSAGGGTVINVNGGLDSADAIARRIQQLLRQRDQRAHGVTITRSLR